ncbi:MAG: hypothetical protein ACR2M7_06045 [Bdellovibrionales bacterium]
MRRLFLGLVLFSFYLNAQTTTYNPPKEPIYTDEQLEAFRYYAEYDRELDAIAHQFVKDVKDQLDIDLDFSTIEVYAFDYTILDDAWGKPTDERKISERIIGLATGMYNDNEVLVLINKDKMASLTFSALKSTVYHELMHDVFNYEHHMEDGKLMSRSLSKADNNINYVEDAIQEAFDNVYYGEHQNHKH